MIDLIESVLAVRAEVQAGEALEDAIAFVARERGVNPELLRRKVQESFGQNVGAKLFALPVFEDGRWVEPKTRSAAEEAMLRRRLPRKR